ncbi:peptidoglycan recognition family protein [Paenibacillus contaminans]|uniref:N-acetylmuramoyl-L-alanine amidase domain-containing protein n=1 Tax=Paenibacillus contaminans TaxID=450362 RepID=A0A329MWH2_9BACL|nr:peptidoglycan recognition family protein [Paenibacillus contaminans]RAV22197.1 hypothetical protein DQG23_04395 [Paenibacillus contaminans]
MSLRKITLVEGLPFKVPPIEDITDTLPKKQSWETLPNKKNIVKGVWDKTYHTGLRKPEDIDTIVVHHSGSPEGTLQAHAGSHSRNWGAGIGYHISIDNGRIYQVNDLLTFSFHVGDHNTYTVGIEVNRDLSKGDLTSQERELLYAAILTVKSLLPIKEILGHNELNKTACPCTSMNRIRDDIQLLENKMKQQDTWEAKKTKVGEIANQYNYMFNLINLGETDGDAHWAMNQLLAVREVLKERKLLD